MGCVYIGCVFNLHCSSLGSACAWALLVLDSGRAWTRLVPGSCPYLVLLVPGLLLVAGSRWWHGLAAQHGRPTIIAVVITIVIIPGWLPSTDCYYYCYYYPAVFARGRRPRTSTYHIPRNIFYLSLRSCNARNPHRPFKPDTHTHTRAHTHAHTQHTPTDNHTNKHTTTPTNKNTNRPTQTHRQINTQTGN